MLERAAQTLRPFIRTRPWTRSRYACQRIDLFDERSADAQAGPTRMITGQRRTPRVSRGYYPGRQWWSAPPADVVPISQHRGFACDAIVQHAGRRLDQVSRRIEEEGSPRCQRSRLERTACAISRHASGSLPKCFRFAHHAILIRGVLCARMADGVKPRRGESRYRCAESNRSGLSSLSLIGA